MNTVAVVDIGEVQPVATPSNCKYIRGPVFGLHSSFINIVVWNEDLMFSSLPSGEYSTFQQRHVQLFSFIELHSTTNILQIIFNVG